MKCPNCNGTLYFNIKEQKLKCRHCSQVFNIDDYYGNNAADEILFEDARFYTCKNCGAELICDDSEAVVYCNYCGSEQLLESSMKGVNEPKKIIPFRISKSKCKQIYQKELKNKLYVPKEFKDPEFIEKFRPFYIPYWMYYVKFREEPIEVEGTKSYTSGGYDYTDTYNVKVRIQDEGLYGVPYDASRNFDDSIAEQIAPFNRKELVDYKEAYLAGMYADVPNVDADVYEKEVLDTATRKAVEDLGKAAGGLTLKIPSNVKKQQQLLDARYEGGEAVYLPVWFLTWRKGDRVAYAIVNGQSGKIHVDLPADIGQFTLYTFAGAALIYIVLSLLLTVTSRFVIWFAALLAYLVGRSYRKELKQIRDRENHVFDKGYLLQDGEELPMSPKVRDRLRMRKLLKSDNMVLKVVVLTVAIIFGSGFFVALGAAYDLLVSQTGAMVMTILVAILEIISFVRTLSVIAFLRNKRSLLFAILTLLAIGYAYVVANLQPVQDWWYYLGALAALGAAALMCIDLILRFNETSTRPLPSFYSRKGGNDNAQDL